MHHILPHLATIVKVPEDLVPGSYKLAVRDALECAAFGFGKGVIEPWETNMSVSAVEVDDGDDA